MKRVKKFSLADQIAGILTTAPTSLDPEDEANDETTACVSAQGPLEENEDEEILSSFRRSNVDLLADLDEKYAGKKASRKDLNSSESEEELSQDSSSDDDISDEMEIDEVESQAGSESESNFKHISDTNVSNQVKKGACVRSQISIWENLLEIRIQLQKCLISANKMPQNDTLREIKESSGEFSSKSNETKLKLCEVLDKMLLLQKLLLKQFPETKSLKEAVGEDVIESDSGTEAEEQEEPQKKKMRLIEYETELCGNHNTYKTYRNSVIQKWNDKTRVALKNDTSHSVLDQIEYNLSNNEKFLQRTRIKRSSYSIIGKIDDECDNEIFDDDDFYHQLLRELIEVKSADLTDPVQLGRQWIQLQSLRSKMKRKIDTKATKGRKIRYDVHNKLVNFMAPIDDNDWTDEAKNELFNSLFGKKV